MKTEYQKVKDFTAKVLEANGKQILAFAEPLDKNEILFLARMVIDELIELMSTKLSVADRKYYLNCIFSSADLRPDLSICETDHDAVRDQTDAFLDAIYYIKDSAARKNLPLDEFFERVHEANMKKVVDGKLKIIDGKVQKPEGWKPPDLDKETIIAMGVIA